MSFCNFFVDTVSFTDLDQGREILNRFSLPKSMKHSVGDDADAMKGRLGGGSQLLCLHRS